MASSRPLSLFSVPFKGNFRHFYGIIHVSDTFSRLNIVDATITTPTIVGVSCAILVLLFLIQPLGTSKIGSMFAPIVIIWLVFNLAFGIYVRGPLLCVHFLVS